MTQPNLIGPNDNNMIKMILRRMNLRVHNDNKSNSVKK